MSATRIKVYCFSGNSIITWPLGKKIVCVCKNSGRLLAAYAYSKSIKHCKPHINWDQYRYVILAFPNVYMYDIILYIIHNFRAFPDAYDTSLYRAHTEAMFKGLLIHLDDSSTDIQVSGLIKFGPHNFKHLLWLWHLFWCIRKLSLMY